MGVLVFGLIVVALAIYSFHQTNNKGNDAVCTPMPWIVVGLAVALLALCAIYPPAINWFSMGAVG